MSHNLIGNVGKIGEALDEFSELKTGDDCRSLVYQTFRRYVKGLPLELNWQLADTQLYWDERSEPQQSESPEGGGLIEWFAKLDVVERQHGVVHVGLDVNTRRFLCYELGKGLYYPEGVMLERIRGQVVQDSFNNSIPIDGRTLGDWKEKES